MTEQIVTPWEVSSKTALDYKKLSEQFGVSLIDEKLLERFEKITGHKPHPWLKRGIFFAHRELDLILNDVEAGKQIFLYTGRGPSSDSLHLGHLMPFMFTKWIQDVFNAILVVQISDDEKYHFKDDMSFEEIYRNGRENIKDIIACGFDPKRTFIFSNYDYAPHMKRNIMEMEKATNINTIKAIFGFKDNASVGQVAWAIKQSVPAFSTSFKHLFGDKNIRCLVPYAIDQDPYFRLCRDFAPKMKYFKPTAIMCKFLPALEGVNAKMSTTGQMQSIFVNDTPKQIKTKINKYAFSGGGATLEEQRATGANLEVDIPYQYLRHFEMDDAKLDKIGNDYRSGKMLSSEIKAILIDVLIAMTKTHQENRLKVTDEIIKQFCTI